jgi:hypothetical protein
MSPPTPPDWLAYHLAPESRPESRDSFLDGNEKMPKDKIIDREEVYLDSARLHLLEASKLLKRARLDDGSAYLIAGLIETAEMAISERLGVQPPGLLA